MEDFHSSFLLLFLQIFSNSVYLPLTEIMCSQQSQGFLVSRSVYFESHSLFSQLGTTISFVEEDSWTFFRLTYSLSSYYFNIFVLPLNLTVGCSKYVAANIFKPPSHFHISVSIMPPFFRNLLHTSILQHTYSFCKLPLFQWSFQSYVYNNLKFPELLLYDSSSYVITSECLNFKLGT